MQIKLLANNTSHRGPGKVYQNLAKGLKLCGHGVNQPIIGDPDLTVCLQYVPEILQLDLDKSLFGPNLVTLPVELRELYSEPLRQFLVPSQWVKDMYSQFFFVNPNNLNVWSVGIDTDLWKPSESKKPTQDCFVYFKNRSQTDLNIVKLLLKKLKLSYSTIEYGKYTEDQLREACETSRFAILLTGTESQGIGYMEILSMGVPCYVFNQPTWKHEVVDISCSASSAPYFSETCGTFSDNHVSLDHFSNFVDSIDKFDPRTYIVQNHSLVGSATKLANILKVTK